MSEDAYKFIIFATRKSQTIIVAMDFYDALEQAEKNRNLLGDVLGIIKIEEFKQY